MNLLSAILNAAVADGPLKDLRVDPRPLMADPKVGNVQTELIARVPPGVLRKRTAVIRAAGLQTVDAIEVGQNKSCPGGFVGGSRDTLAVRRVHSGCPTEAFYVLAIALPRQGRDIFPSNEPYDLQTESPARGYWAARVIRTFVGRGGSNLEESDYVLENKAGRWRVIKIVRLAYSE